MSPASPSDRLKWRKRKRDVASSSLKRQKNHEDEDEDEEEEDDPAEDDDNNENNQDSPANADPILDLRGSEVLSDAGQRISEFPSAVKRSVSRPHPSVIGLVAAERFGNVRGLPLMENLSHGQLQAVSSVPRDSLTLSAAAGEQERTPAYVCTPPVLMEGKGVPKKFSDGRVHLVPMHSGEF